MRTPPPCPEFTGRDIALDELLAARERRAHWQAHWHARHGGTLVVLSVLTPGAVKSHAFGRAVFAAALPVLDCLWQARGWRVIAHCHWQEDSGEVAWWSVDAPAHTLKRQLLLLEESLPVGRLWDIDVIGADGKPLSRQALGQAPRRCLVCNDDAKICARERRHSLAELHTAMRRRWQEERFAARLARHMRQALAEEALLTPKPALVDMDNHDSHPDMDADMLLRSAKVLEPYFAAMAIAGMNHHGQPDPALLAAIRPLGMAAERAMLQETGGVNTHKGAIFAFGLWAAVLGWQCRHAPHEDHTHSAAHIRALCGGLMDELALLAARPPQTGDSAGVRLYRTYGLGGARAEAAQGFPLIWQQALPVWQREHLRGSARRAWLLVLLSLITANDDSTTVSRGGMEALRWAQAHARQLLHDAQDADERTLVRALRHFDEQAASRRLSFGGSADLLALTMFLHREHDECLSDALYTMPSGLADTAILLLSAHEELYGQENLD